MFNSNAMRKEVALAITAGILLGVVFAFGSWKVAQGIKKRDLSEIINQIQQPTKKEVINQLTIDSPSNYSVLNNNTVVVSGITRPNSYVLASSANEDYLAKSDEAGEFKIDVNLKKGLNEIIIEKKKLRLTYFSDATDENLNSYVGLITDITDQTIQIRSESGEIQLISTDEATKSLNGKSNFQSIPLTDIGIGDYVVAIGTINGNKVLNSQFLFTSDEPKTIEPTIYYSTFVKGTTRNITIKTDGDEEKVIVLPRTWKGPEIKTLKENESIIVATTISGETETLRSLFTVVE